MDKSIQDILRLWSDESDNITKRMDQFKTTTDMIEFLKNKIDQLKGLASMKDAPEILQSLNLLRESVMQLQSAEDRAHDRTSIATDAKSGQAVVDFVMKHILKMNDKLRDIEHKVGENKQLEQDAQQLKRELEDRKLASRDIEQKTGENKRLEQNIHQLKDELEKSKLASSELSVEKEMVDRSIEDLLIFWSDESDIITKPMDHVKTTMDKIEFLKNKIDQLQSLVFMKDKTEILRSINLLRDSVMQLQSDDDVSHERTNIATDAKSGKAVVDFVMKHIFGMNDKLIKLEGELNVEIEKRTELINEGATDSVITRDTQYKDEMEAKTVMLEKLENSNFNLDEKLKDLQAQILQCKQQNWRTAEENHIFCKERDELKNRVKSMEKLLNEK
ncbi:CAP-Gly domain-containing linker protein 1-like [Mytilus edulis]|uniref:CAP-Gly domain-containing linker protein 1-like n=1 Tax=Mytilus edulis TaxID=6550 RepID=UPI0039F09D85